MTETPERRSPEVLQSELSRLTGRTIRLVLTRNRSTFLSCLPPDSPDQPMKMRVHSCFLTAPDPVLRALAAYALRPSRKDTALLRQFAEAQMGSVGEEVPTRRLPRLRSRGIHHDLHGLLEGVLAAYFAGEGLQDVRITYGRGGSGGERGRRSIHYGAFHYTTRTITIHPALDSADVPRYFVEFVIFHELIHALLPKPEVVGGRRKIHDEEFRRRERSHPDYERAQVFSREFLHRAR